MKTQAKEGVTLIKVVDEAMLRSKNMKSLYNEEDKTRIFKDNMINRMGKDNGSMEGIIDILNIDLEEWVA